MSMDIPSPHEESITVVEAADSTTTFEVLRKWLTDRLAGTQKELIDVGENAPTVMTDAREAQESSERAANIAGRIQELVNVQEVLDSLDKPA